MQLTKRSVDEVECPTFKKIQVVQQNCSGYIFSSLPNYIKSNKQTIKSVITKKITERYRNPWSRTESLHYNIMENHTNNQ